MNVMTLCVGLFCLLIALIFGYRSVKCKTTDGRLKVMTSMLGEKKGLMFFRFTYVLMPLFIGVIIISAGLDGYSMAEFVSGAHRSE